MIIAIDPGNSGCIVVLTETGQYVNHLQVPTIKLSKSTTRVNGAAVSAYINRWHGVTHCFIEKVHSMPKQGVSSTFTFAHAAGLLEGIIAGAGIPYTMVVPAQWKKFASLVNQEKDAARAKAIQLYPDIPDLSLKAKGQALADAIFIGLYGLKIQSPKRGLV